MIRRGWRLHTVVLLQVCLVAAPLAAAGSRWQAATQAASSAAQASPELVGLLSKEIGATPEQAAGAAGSLFGVAKSRLNADDFSQVSKAVPGMDALLKAAPAAGSGAAGALSQMAGSAVASRRRPPRSPSSD